MPQRSLGSQLGQLALSLLNATLLLSALLAFGLWLLMGRAQDFAADTAVRASEAVGANLGEQMATLDATLARLATVESRINDAVLRAGTADGPAVAELQALGTEVKALTAAVVGLTATARSFRDQPAEAVSGQLSKILQGLAARLGPPQPPLP